MQNHTVIRLHFSWDTQGTLLTINNFISRIYLRKFFLRILGASNRTKRIHQMVISILSSKKWTLKPLLEVGFIWYFNDVRYSKIHIPQGQVTKHINSSLHPRHTTSSRSACDVTSARLRHTSVDYHRAGL